MRKILVNLALVMFSMITASTTKAAIIDTAVITVNASGSLNTIVGSGNIDSLLLIPEDATFSYFTVELSSFLTTPDYLGLPQSLSLSFWNSSLTSGAGLYWNLNSGIYVGKTFIVSASDNSNVYDFMLGFNSGSAEPIPVIRTGMAWGFGGVDGSASATFLVTAHGDVAPVPLPASIWLLISGLSTVAALRKHRNVH